MFYSLYNNQNKTHLTHPLVGIWYTEDKQEAEDMLIACQQYLIAMQLNELVEHISIVEVKNDEYTYPSGGLMDAI